MCVIPGNGIIRFARNAILVRSVSICTSFLSLHRMLRTHCSWWRASWKTLFAGQLIHAPTPAYKVPPDVYGHSSLYPPLLSFNLSYFPELFPAFQKVPYSELKRTCYNGASTKGRGRSVYPRSAYRVHVRLRRRRNSLQMWSMWRTLQFTGWCSKSQPKGPRGYRAKRRARIAGYSNVNSGGR